MNKNVAVLIALSLLLSCCVRKKTSQVPTKKEKTGQVAGTKKSVHDEEVEPFVLDDDADYDVFDQAAAVEGKKGHRTPKSTEQKTVPAHGELQGQNVDDDSWAWEELDEEQPTKVVQFQFDSAKIDESQMPKVRYDAELAKYACEDGATIVIEGHSCLITRSQIYNQALSQRRADSVKKEFIKSGVHRRCIKSVGRGTSQLLTRAEGKVAQAPNRRVEVKFVYPKGEHKPVIKAPAYPAREQLSKKGHAEAKRKA